MANDVRYGLAPVKMENGDLTIPVHEYYINSSYATALYIGDPVATVAGGSNAAVVQKRRIGSLREIEKCTAGNANPCVGVIVGFLPKVGIAETVLHNAASTERIALVADHPRTIFRAQSEGTVAAADVGLNSNFIFTHGGSTTTGLSGVEIDDTLNTTAAHQVKIVGIAEKFIESDDNAVGANADYLVLINNHQNGNAVAGV